MATIKKIDYASGRKVWKVRYRDNGKQREKNFDRSKDANDFKINIEATQRDGTYVSPSKMPLSDYLLKWIAYKKTSLAPKTYDSYETTIKKIAEIIGDISLQKLTVTEIEMLYTALLEKGLSSTSCNYYHRILKSALKQAVKDRLLPFNPADLADPPKKIKAKTDIVHPDDIGAFLSCFNGHPIEMAVYICTFTGLRRAEVCGLKWSDIDLKRCSLTVCRTLHYKNREFTELLPKNKQTRKIPFPKGLIPMFKHKKEEQNRHKAHFKESYYHSDYINVHQDGIPFIPEYLSHTYVKLRAEAFEGIRFHDLRHTAASLMLYHGADIKTVSDVLGHSSVTITGDLYLHVVEELKRSAIDALDIYIDKESTIVPFRIAK